MRRGNADWSVEKEKEDIRGLIGVVVRMEPSRSRDAQTRAKLSGHQDLRGSVVRKRIHRECPVNEQKEDQKIGRSGVLFGGGLPEAARRHFCGGYLSKMARSNYTTGT